MLGVGSFVYLPEKNDPPFLDCIPNGAITGAIDPEAVAPAEADSVISYNLIVYPQLISLHCARAVIHPDIFYPESGQIGFD